MSAITSTVPLTIMEPKTKNVKSEKDDLPPPLEPLNPPKEAIVPTNPTNPTTKQNTDLEPKSKETKEEKIKRLNDEIIALKNTKVDLEYVKKMLHILNQMMKADSLPYTIHEEYLK